MHYESILHCESITCEGVSYRIRRMSFGRRLELLKRLRAYASDHEMHAATDSADGRLATAMSEAEIRRAYMDWGLAGIAGLTIDGKAATPETLIEAGPEALCREIAERIRGECFLSEEERKN